MVKKKTVVPNKAGAGVTVEVEWVKSDLGGRSDGARGTDEVTGPAGTILQTPSLLSLQRGRPLALSSPVIPGRPSSGKRPATLAKHPSFLRWAGLGRSPSSPGCLVCVFEALRADLRRDAGRRVLPLGCRDQVSGTWNLCFPICKGADYTSVLYNPSRVGETRKETIPGRLSLRACSITATMPESLSLDSSHQESQTQLLQRNWDPNAPPPRARKVLIHSQHLPAQGYSGPTQASRLQTGTKKRGLAAARDHNSWKHHRQPGLLRPLQPRAVREPLTPASLHLRVSTGTPLRPLWPLPDLLHSPQAPCRAYPQAARERPSPASSRAGVRGAAPRPPGSHPDGAARGGSPAPGMGMGGLASWALPAPCSPARRR
ncbi:hypothetical protein P7K49_033994 [Saguinus oedipus]|uniref:Uncharacterized protein n=1 Tax=Saguinus oedipus TaxID=9490 RepID=A0ABQ9TVA0_SAGOE|nr:hypothetical protein P7K49_033994 [Saguinus oedipus]